MNAFQKANRIKNLGVEIESMQFEFAHNQNDMFEDSKCLEHMYEQCATTETEWDIRCEIRAEELLTRANTFKILDDDGASEFFKQTFPSPAALLQTGVSVAQIQQQALSIRLAQ